MSDQTTIERLAAIEDIKQLFAGRLLCLDLKDWDHYGDFHTEDVVSDTWRDQPGRSARESKIIVGRDALTDAIRQALGGEPRITTVHHGHSPTIRFTSRSSAEATWAMEDKLWWDNHGREEHLRGYGHYHEEYRLVNGEWRISRRTLSRLRVDATPDFFAYLRGRS